MWFSASQLVWVRLEVSVHAGFFWGGKKVEVYIVKSLLSSFVLYYNVSHCNSWKRLVISAYWWVTGWNGAIINLQAQWSEAILHDVHTHTEEKRACGLKKFGKFQRGKPNSRLGPKVQQISRWDENPSLDSLFNFIWILLYILLIVLKSPFHTLEFMHFLFRLLKCGHVCVSSA